MSTLIQKKKVSSPAEHLLKHSPLKKGLKIKNEDLPLTDYSKITPKIYIGNIQAAQDTNFFKTKKIKAVLNCSNDIPNYFRDSDIEYLRIPIDDSLNAYDFNKMYHLLSIAAEFIHKHVDILKNKIFIHCYAGRQRSISSCVAYFIKYNHMQLKQACKFIMEKRPEAFHFGKSFNFDQSLQEFYNDTQNTPFKIRNPTFKSSR